jgi:hypothetical protein
MRQYISYARSKIPPGWTKFFSAVLDVLSLSCFQNSSAGLTRLPRAVIDIDRINVVSDDRPSGLKLAGTVRWPEPVPTPGASNVEMAPKRLRTQLEPAAYKAVPLRDAQAAGGS